MKFIDQLKEKAKQNKKTIVLPETSDMRTIEAAGKVLAEGIANIILVGDKEVHCKIFFSRHILHPLMKYPITTPTAVKKNANPVNFFQIKNHHHNDLLSLYVVTF